MNPKPKTTNDAIEHVVDILARCRSLLFITGAGISADSGLPTYRGIGGLYNNEHPEEGFVGQRPEPPRRVHECISASAPTCNLWLGLPNRTQPSLSLQIGRFLVIFSTSHLASAPNVPQSCETDALPPEPTSAPVT